MAFRGRKQYNPCMKVFLFSACFVLALLLPASLRAQDAPVAAPLVVPALPETPALPLPVVEGEVVTDPICFNVINNAPYTVFGTFITNIYTAEDGSKARHRSNFRLEAGFKSEFCTYGPFYEGRKLELVLRTLIPVFSCKTGINGDIMIYGRKKPEGGTDTWAVCL